MASTVVVLPPAFYQVCGLYIAPTPGATALTAPVPLLGVAVDAHVVDLCTRAVVSQHYCNREAVPIEAVYVFPLDSRSAVCGFEVEIDGKITKGEVQEKHQARATYDSAIARGDTAQLLEQKRGDIFQMSVGNLQPGQHCTVNITYVSDLKIEGDAVKFFVPTFIAPRYNPASEKDPIIGGGATRVGRDGLEILVTATMASAVTQVQCTTHSVRVTHTPGSSVATIALEGRVEKLDKDFELLITTAEPHQPRVIVERHESGVAAAVTLAPKFELDEARCELIFLVDRSGSMGGSNIDQAQKALQLFLRSLPTDCYFNIVGFGSRFTSLWATSQKYQQSSLSTASSHVASLRADLGGTELMQPLRHIFQQPLVPGYARQVFVLTDGQVSNTQEIINEVGKNASLARVFALGLGSGASHELVEGIARAGKGTSDFALQEDRLESKVIQQLTQAIQPALTEVSVEWEGVEAVAVAQAATTSVAGAIGSLLGFKKPSQMDLHGYAQAPFRVPPVFSGSRFLVFCMLQPGAKAPRGVTIKAQTPEGPLAVQLPVREEDMLDGDVIHTMAARALIQDLEDGASWLHGKSGSKMPSEEAVHKEIVRLGLQYKLASKHTSYVAVQRNEHHAKVEIPVYVGQIPVALPVAEAPTASMTVSAAMMNAPRFYRQDESEDEDEGACNDLFGDDSSAVASVPPASRGMAQPASTDRRCELQQPIMQTRPASADRRMQQLVLQQEFDGSFLLSEGLAASLGQTLGDLRSKQPSRISAEAWATALAMAFFASKCQAFESEWQLVASKARKWLSKALTGSMSIDQLLDQAKSCV